MRDTLEQHWLNIVVDGVYVIVDWHLGDTADPSPYQAQAISFFQQIAKTYGSYPHVLYETWNEPLQVKDISHYEPYRIFQADWNSVLKPYHEALISAIRTIDAKNVILLGTPGWSGADGLTAASNSPITG